MVAAKKPSVRRSTGCSMRFVTRGWEQKRIEHYEATLHERNKAMSPR